MCDVRIVSLSRRRPHRGLLAMMRTFHDDFILPAEEQFEVLRGLVGWPVIFSALLEVLGESPGCALFGRALEKAGDGTDELARELRVFLDRIAEEGFVPMRLHFAIMRYRRWAALSTDSTSQARALMLRELYETYGLAALADDYPEIRVRFYLETVFRDSPAPLTGGLRQIIRTIRSGELPIEELIDAVDELRAREKLDEDDAYFLARLSYPYLRPEDAAGFVHSDLGGKRLSEIVVTLEDNEGRPFRVRHALNPKEVERLLRLFLAAKLDVRFRPEHQYLVAINERMQIIAGIYYEIDEESRSAHLEKIVVAERHRRMGVADGLMSEFFNRLRAGGLKTVTTGFFRPEYFYSYGFRIERRYSGLVKSLEETEEQETER
jgi:N-acetylglutamate synthase-like GNAT family acetyltransferase